MKSTLVIITVMLLSLFLFSESPEKDDFRCLITEIMMTPLHDYLYDIQLEKALMSAKEFDQTLTVFLITLKGSPDRQKWLSEVALLADFSGRGYDAEKMTMEQFGPLPEYSEKGMGIMIKSLHKMYDQAENYSQLKHLYDFSKKRIPNSVRKELEKIKQPILEKMSKLVSAEEAYEMAVIYEKYLSISQMDTLYDIIFLDGDKIKNLYSSQPENRENLFEKLMTRSIKEVCQIGLLVRGYLNDRQLECLFSMIIEKGTEEEIKNFTSKLREKDQKIFNKLSKLRK